MDIQPQVQDQPQQFVPMVDPDGAVWRVPKDKVETAKQKYGAKEASPELIQAWQGGGKQKYLASRQPQAQTQQGGLPPEVMQQLQNTRFGWYPKGMVPTSLMESLMARKMQMDAQQGRGQQSFLKDHTQVNEDMLKNYPAIAKMGLKPGEYVPNRFLQDQSKPTSPSIGIRDTQFKEKRLTALGDALDPSKQRAGAFGVSKQVFDRAERLQSLASAFKDGNLDSRQLEELAIGLNAMLSGSNTGAQEQVKSLVPHTIIGNASKFKEWLVNDPQGTNQQAFVQRMLGSIDREKSTAGAQIKRTQFQRIQRYADLEKASPDDFYNVLQSQGVDPEEYKSWRKGGFKPQSSVQKPEDAKSSEFDDLYKRHGL